MLKKLKSRFSSEHPGRAPPPRTLAKGGPNLTPPEQLSGKSPSTPLSRSPRLHPPGTTTECRVDKQNDHAASLHEKVGQQSENFASTRILTLLAFSPCCPMLGNGKSGENQRFFSGLSQPKQAAQALGWAGLGRALGWARLWAGLDFGLGWVWARLWAGFGFWLGWAGLWAGPGLAWAGLGLGFGLGWVWAAANC